MGLHRHRSTARLQPRKRQSPPLLAALALAVRVLALRAWMLRAQMWRQGIRSHLQTGLEMLEVELEIMTVSLMGSYVAHMQQPHCFAMIGSSPPRFSKVAQVGRLGAWHRLLLYRHATQGSLTDPKP